jgi:hypothetical protein
MRQHRYFSTLIRAIPEEFYEGRLSEDGID